MFLYSPRDNDVAENVVALFQFPNVLSLSLSHTHTHTHTHFFSPSLLTDRCDTWQDGPQWYVERRVGSSPCCWGERHSSE